MTTDYRDLITRMAKELDEYRQLLLDDRTVTHRLSDEARAALADGPAVPQGREPASVTGQPSDEELALIYHDCCRGCEFMDQVNFENAARAVITRWGNPAPPSADAEVAELVAWLRETGDTIQPSHLAEHQRYKRAAELLQRQAMPEVGA